MLAGCPAPSSRFGWWNWGKLCHFDALVLYNWRIPGLLFHLFLMLKGCLRHGDFDLQAARLHAPESKVRRTGSVNHRVQGFHYNVETVSKYFSGLCLVRYYRNWMHLPDFFWSGCLGQMLFSSVESESNRLPAENQRERSQPLRAHISNKVASQPPLYFV